MRPPIFVNYNHRFDVAGDLNVYPTVSAAEGCIEFYDADDPDLYVLDADGRRLTARSNARTHAVQLERSGEAAEHREVLMGWLTAYLSGRGHAAPKLAAMTLDDLVRAAATSAADEEMLQYPPGVRLLLAGLGLVFIVFGACALLGRQILGDYDPYIVVVSGVAVVAVVLGANNRMNETRRARFGREA